MIGILVFLLYLALGFATVVAAAYKGTLWPGDANDVLAAASMMLVWPVVWAGVALYWFVNLPIRMGRSFR